MIDLRVAIVTGKLNPFNTFVDICILFLQWMLSSVIGIILTLQTNIFMEQSVTDVRQAKQRTKVVKCFEV